ncbi:MAG: hypothetical protein MRY83_16555 [Flavobacteriales bacterium]|nr:hypothetical protein [Flavobacteriales bacterium]
MSNLKNIKQSVFRRIFAELEIIDPTEFQMRNPGFPHKGKHQYLLIGYPRQRRLTYPNDYENIQNSKP